MEHYDQFIAGGGIGGLLSASLLGQHGQKCFLVERLPFFGGRFTSIKHHGFEIPTGAVHMIPHSRNGPLGEVLLRDLNLPLEIIKNIRQENHVQEIMDSFEQYYNTPVSEMDIDKYIGIILVDGLSSAEEKLMEKIGDLTDSQIEKIQETINNVSKNAPGWMLNHRKDYETGTDIHLISSDIDMRIRDEINIMKKIRSYRGIRHERGLTVRGQRTRANNRKGLALGVSKKRGIESK